MTQPLILLTGYAAKQCARRVHNEWDPTIESVLWQTPPELQMRFDAGIAFEADVFATLESELGAERCRNLTNIAGKSATIAATLEAMDQGVEVVLGGWLPDDVLGGRAGKPDILLRHSQVEGAWTYVPGDVKAHQTTAKRARGVLRFSRPAQPQLVEELPGHAAQTSSRLDDHLQLAHYWRMLQACGRAPEELTPRGFIIGTDQLADLEPLGVVLVWLDLAAPTFETYSRSRGTAKRTAMERYDHEQGFRLKVARVAASRTGDANDPPPLVEPIFKDECDSCPWYDYCRGVTGEGVASDQIRSGRLSVREWHALTAHGISSVEDLAGLDLADQAFLDSYLPEVSHVRDPLGRLQVAVRRASMIEAGVTIERETNGPIPVPRADIEIDFDIEWDPDNRVYLWGALVNRAGAQPEYVPAFSWQILDDASERLLAQQFATWLRGVVTAAEAQGQTVLIYHYSTSRTEAPQPTAGHGERRRSDRPLRGPARTCSAALLRTRGPRNQEGGTGVRVHTGATKIRADCSRSCGFSRPGTSTTRPSRSRPSSASFSTTRTMCGPPQS